MSWVEFKVINTQPTEKHINFLTKLNEHELSSNEFEIRNIFFFVVFMAFVLCNHKCRLNDLLMCWRLAKSILDFLFHVIICINKKNGQNKVNFGLKFLNKNSIVYHISLHQKLSIYAKKLPKLKRNCIKLR